MSRWYVLFLLVVLTVSSISSAQAAPQKEVKFCVVAGKVVKGDTPEPVRKAKVTLRSTSPSDNASDDDETIGNPSATTDQDGNFVFENVRPGTYTLAIEKTGYAGLSNGRSRNAKATRRMTLTPGQEMRDLLIRMVASASVTGRVLDQDGEPMAHASVRVLRYRYGGRSKRQLRPVDFAQTNDLGEYRVFGLEPGEYYLSVNVREGRDFTTPAKDTSGKIDYQYPTTYYPGVTNDTDAQALPLRAGDEGRVDFNLIMAPAVKVSGRVIGLGDARDGFRGVVQAISASGESGGRAMIKEGTDTFEITGLMPGSYTLMGVGAPKGDSFTQVPMGSTKVTVSNGDVSGIVITLAADTMRQQQIKGKINITGGPAENADHLGVMLRPANWRDEDAEVASLASMAGGRSGAIKKDGTFTMEAYGTGSVIATVFGTGSGVEDYYTKSVRYAGRDVTETGFSLATNSQLEVEIGADGGRVEGIVMDEKDKPVSEATVVLVPDGQQRQLPDNYATEHTDQNGHFLMRGVRPGSYTIYAWDDLGDDDGAYYYDDFLKKFTDKAQPVRVEAKGRAAVKVNVISAEPVAQAEP